MPRAPQQQRRTTRAPLGALAIALWLAGCATPLGPGFRIEEQELSAEYLPGPEPAVLVRAVWRVENNGNQPLDGVDIGLPDTQRHGLRNIRAEVAGTAVDAAGAGSGSLRVPFGAPLGIGETCEVTVSYELRGLADESGGTQVTNLGFLLPPGDWAPVLLRPKGTFAAGGVPPKKWEMTVRVPAGWRVHASGKSKGIEHRKDEQDQGETYSFAERRDGFPPFAVGGAFHEARAKSNGQEVIFWTREALPAGVAQRGAEAAARTAQFYDAAFGPRKEEARRLWVIECPAKHPCWAVPETALVGSEIEREDSWSGFLVELEQQLAYTWLDFRVHPDWEKEPLPMAAMAEYATELAAAEREGANARRIIIHGLVANFDYQKERQPEPPVESVQLSDPQSARQFASVKSELFLFALEDEAGRENLLRAVRHLLGTYRSGIWRADDLRSAAEQESGKDLGPLFREWLAAPGIPSNFRSRY